MKIYYIAILSILFLSCNQPTNNEIKELKYKKKKDYLLPLPKDYFKRYILLDKIDNEHIALTSGYNKILVYNIKQERLIKEIPISPFKQVISFNYLHSDSIYILYSKGSLRNEYSDSSFVQINEKGEIINAIVHDTKEFLSEYNPKGNYTVSGFQFAVNNQSIALPLHKWLDQPTKDSTFFCEAIVDRKSFKLTINKDVSEPYENKGLYDMKITRISNFNNKFIVGHNYSNWITIDDRESKKLKNHRLETVFVDSIPLDMKENQKGYNKRNSMFSKPWVSPFSQKYFRDYRYVYNNFGEKIYLTSVYNEKLELIAEGITPEDVYAIEAWDKDIVIGYNRNKTKTLKDTLVVSTYELKYEKFRLQERLDSILETSRSKNTKRSIKNYVKNDLGIIGGNFALIILEPEHTCPSCVENIYKYFSDYSDVFEEMNTFLNISSSNQQMIENSLKKYGIDTQHEFLLLEKNGLFSNYRKSKHGEPTLVIYKNGKIVFEKAYPPIELEKLYAKMQEYYDENVQ